MGFMDNWFSKKESTVANEEPDEKDAGYYTKSSEQLAILCKEGDADAMLDMAQYFLYRCSQDEIDMLTLRVLPEKRSFFSLNAKSYMMWVCRAAYYGNNRAAELLASHPYFAEEALVPTSMLENEEISRIKLYSGGDLWKAGIIDADVDYEEGDSYNYLRFYGGLRYYKYSYISYYFPRDEDGFGEETEYSDVYFDEFFNLLPIDGEASEEKIKEALAAVGK